MWHLPCSPPLGTYNKLSFHCQLSPDLLASPYLKNNKAYILTCYLLLSGWQKLHRLTTYSAGETVGKQAFPHMAGGNTKWLNIYEGEFGANKTIFAFWPINLPSRNWPRIYISNNKRNRHTGTRLLIAASFVIVKRWKHTEHLDTGNSLNKLQNTPTVVRGV